MIAELLKDILYGDKSKGRRARYREQGDFANIRQYCEHRLGWSYEYCRTLIRAGDIAASYPQIGSISAHAANQLARLGPEKRDEVVAAISDKQIEPTGAAIRMYAEAAISIDSGLLDTHAQYAVLSSEVDRRIELQVVGLLKNHSDPMAGLLKAQGQLRLLNEDRTHADK